MPKAMDKPFKWDDAAKEMALNFVFEGRLSQNIIAEKCHIAPRTLRNWIAHPGFAQRLEEKRADLDKALTGVIYADKSRRIIALSMMAEQARTEFEAHPMLREIRPLPAKTVIRIPLKPTSMADADAPNMMETEPMDAIVNESFNRDAFESFRGALDDIAKEKGERRPQQDQAPTTVNNVFVGVPHKVAGSVTDIIMQRMGVTSQPVVEAEHGPSSR